VRKKVVAMSVIGFFIYLIIREIIQAYYQYFVYMKEPKDVYNIELGNWIRGIEIFIVIIILLISNGISVVKLTVTKNRADGDIDSETKLKNRATVTVIILSILFTTFNSMLLTAIVLETVAKIDLSWDFILWYSIPMNSAVNPIVYIIRIKQMRRHIINKLMTLKHFIFCGDRDINVIANTQTGNPLSFA
jgi:hypothetical protein